MLGDNLLADFGSFTPIPLAIDGMDGFYWTFSPPILRITADTQPFTTVNDSHLRVFKRIFANRLASASNVFVPNDFLAPDNSAFSYGQEIITPATSQTPPYVSTRLAFGVPNHTPDIVAISFGTFPG